MSLVNTYTIGLVAVCGRSAVTRGQSAVTGLMSISDPHLCCRHSVFSVLCSAVSDPDLCVFKRRSALTERSGHIMPRLMVLSLTSLTCICNVSA